MSLAVPPSGVEEIPMTSNVLPSSEIVEPTERLFDWA